MRIELTNHAKYRLMERRIDVTTAKKVVREDIKTKRKFDGKLIASGKTHDGHTIDVVYKKLLDRIIIITAYYGG